MSIGQLAGELYKTDGNWIHLSRDLLGIPRRYMLDFSAGATRDPNWLPPAIVGWAMVIAVLEVTIRLAVLRRDTTRATTGPAAAFLILGAG